MNSQLNSSEAKGDYDLDDSFRKEHKNTPSLDKSGCVGTVFLKKAFDTTTSF